MKDNSKTKYSLVRINKTKKHRRGFLLSYFVKGMDT